MHETQAMPTIKPISVYIIAITVVSVVVLAATYYLISRGIVRIVAESPQNASQSVPVYVCNSRITLRRHDGCQLYGNMFFNTSDALVFDVGSIWILRYRVVNFTDDASGKIIRKIAEDDEFGRDVVASMSFARESSAVRDERQSVIIVNVLVVIVICLLLLVLACCFVFLKVYRPHVRSKSGLCAMCGYDVKSAFGVVCPECGRVSKK